MKHLASFRVYGEPKGQPRPSATRRYRKGHAGKAGMYDPGTAEGWKARVDLAGREHLRPAAGDVRSRGYRADAGPDRDRRG